MDFSVLVWNQLKLFLSGAWLSAAPVYTVERGRRRRGERLEPIATWYLGLHFWWSSEKASNSKLWIAWTWAWDLFSIHCQSFAQENLPSNKPEGTSGLERRAIDPSNSVNLLLNGAVVPIARQQAPWSGAPWNAGDGLDMLMQQRLDQKTSQELSTTCHWLFLDPQNPFRRNLQRKLCGRIWDKCLWMCPQIAWQAGFMPLYLSWTPIPFYFCRKRIHIWLCLKLRKGVPKK